MKEIKKAKIKQAILPSILLVPSMNLPETLCLPKRWPNNEAAASPNAQENKAIKTQYFCASPLNPQKKAIKEVTTAANTLFSLREISYYAIFVLL